MAWISYAQNAEDVRLRRAFAGQSSGFYIDVGANHPVELSVTKHFYESGWSGVNVEPLPKQFALIEQDRPRDTNLNLACSSQPGTLKLYAARGTASGMSSFTVEEVKVHRENGFEFDEISTEVVTLASICEMHAAGKSIDFLSVDVEGHEREVLEGADFSRFRPRVVLVEATRPNTTEPTHDRWEHLILDHAYRFAVFDGLNRFYVRAEDEQLIPALALAPNVFDDFVPHVYKRQIDELKAQVAATRLVNGIAQPIAAVSRAANRLKEWVVSRHHARRG
jgi:FkbM family methyltransferase